MQIKTLPMYVGTSNSKFPNAKISTVTSSNFICSKTFLFEKSTLMFVIFKFEILSFRTIKYRKFGLLNIWRVEHLTARNFGILSEFEQLMVEILAFGNLVSEKIK
jgi:hypothetical protein